MECKYKLGLLLIFTVETLGITFAEILQGIFKEYNHPFIVTYIQISLLVLYLPLAFVTAWLQRPVKQCFGWRSIAETSSSSESHEGDADDYSDLERLMINTDDGLSQDRKLTTFGVAKLAMTIAPFWFISQYLNNAALARTSVTSAIILVSTSSAFTLWIGKLLNQDSVNWLNLVSVIVSVTGVALTTFGHTWKAADEPTSTSIFNLFISLIRNGGRNFIGDILALLSAISEAIFTVLLKRYAGEGEGLDMRVLYGYIGLFTLSSLWCLEWPLVALGLEHKFELPGIDEMKAIICSGLVGTLCDYAWGVGVAWTTPLVATIGSSLSIPIAMLEDMLIHKQHYSLLYAFGSLLVIAGFGIANVPKWFSTRVH